MKKIMPARLPKPDWSWLGYFLLLIGLLLALAVGKDALFGQLDASGQVWAQLALLLLIAAVAGRLVQQWNQPLPMMLLLLGVLISPTTIAIVWPLAVSVLAPVLGVVHLSLSATSAPHLIANDALLSTFAQLGALFLLLRAGLHSKLSDVFNTPNLIVALGGVLLPFALGYFYFLCTGSSTISALFIGAALTATSVGITAAVLEERGELAKPFAQMILGAAVIDDILALMVLGLVRAIPAGLGPSAVGPLLSILLISIAFIGGGLVAGLYVMKQFFSKDEPQLSSRTLAALLSIVFFYALCAQALGLSAIIGAFLAGLVISHSAMARPLSRALFPFDVMFTPIFFIWLGMLFDISALPALLIPLIAILLIAIIGKVAGCAIPARLLGADWNSSLSVGVGMVPRGEMALLIALMGLSILGPSGQPLLSSAQYTLIAAMALLTTLMTPIGLNLLRPPAKSVPASRSKTSPAPS